MTRIRRPALILAGLAISALLFAGCKATGGGWINSAQGTGGKKATFGFVWQTDNDKSVVQGSWSDGYVKFRLDGGMVLVPSGECAYGQGTYVPQSTKTYPYSGTVYIEVCDYGEPGPTSGDYLEIHLQGGSYDGYSNSGTLQGGNLQVKQQ